MGRRCKDVDIEERIPKNPNSPLEAIRYKCYECSGSSWHEVSNCPVTKCILYPFRFGKRPSTIDRKNAQTEDEE